MIELLIVGPLQTNCYILPLPAEGQRKKSCILVDPGGDSQIIIAHLQKLGFLPSIIVLTHGHFDHLLALDQLVEYVQEQGGQPDIAIHSAESNRLGPNADRVHREDFLRIGALEFMNSHWRSLPAATRLLMDGDAIGPFKVLHVPGHSPGSIALWNERKKILISGDCLFRSGVGRTDLPGGDAASLRSSLQRLLRLPAKTRVYPGHGSATSIADEQAWLDF